MNTLTNQHINTINLAVFASGTGSNAKKIIEYFRHHANINVRLVVSNKKDAPVLDLARSNHIETLVLDRITFYETEDFLQQLHARNIEWIILAGFLWLLPPYVVHAYNRRIVNIHPALLPRHGGKGMYGMRVHEAVKASGDQETGITIHYADTNYDEGDLIFQQKCTVHPEDTPEDIARNVQRLEHAHFAPVIAKLVMGVVV
jgi:phosphoribosylglycinamide formyltransferase-1